MCPLALPHLNQSPVLWIVESVLRQNSKTKCQASKRHALNISEQPVQPRCSKSGSKPEGEDLLWKQFNTKVLTRCQCLKENYLKYFCSFSIDGSSSAAPVTVSAVCKHEAKLYFRKQKKPVFLLLTSYSHSVAFERVTVLLL